MFVLCAVRTFCASAARAFHALLSAACLLHACWFASLGYLSRNHRCICINGSTPALGPAAPLSGTGPAHAALARRMRHWPGAAAGKIEQWGIDPVALKHANPALIVARISG